MGNRGQNIQRLVKEAERRKRRHDKLIERRARREAKTLERKQK
jgi:hypothetical protein